MAECVNGSNYIERLGASLAIARQRVWDGEDISAESVDESPDEYAQHLADIRHTGPSPNPSAGREEVILSRREILHHARAMRFILEKMCEEGGLTEEVIKETHSFSVEGID